MMEKTKWPAKNPSENLINTNSHLIKTHNDKIVDLVVSMIDDIVYNSTPECLLDAYKDIDEESALKEISNNYLKEGMRE